MIDRRSFIRCVGMFVGILISLPARLVQAKSLAIPLSKAKKLEKPGGSMILKVKGQQVLFIRDTQETIRALDPICTHKGCTLAYNKKAKRIDCPCHQSAFDLKGGVVNGPASTPLKAYDAKLDGDRIILSLG
ncbi:ubiquinol-cytochrome c reductase iron-sulfur subunit [Thermodesulfobacteriota bacterium]